MAFLGELAAGVLGSVANGMVNNYFSRKSMEDQSEQNIKQTDYLYGKYLSPQAQARNYASAGFNPAQALNNGNISTLNPSAPMPQAPSYTTGLENLTQLSDYYKALADAKKAGVDTLVAEQDAKLKAIQNKREDFELYLRKKFGLSQTANEVALAYENVLLARQQGQINEVEKAIKEWTKAKEKALAESEGTRKLILEKEFANTDKRIELENRVLETQGTANVASTNASNASAEASRTQADVNRQNRRIQSALADIEEVGKIDKIQSLISQYQKEGAISEADAAEARIRASRLHDVEDKRDSKFFKAIDDYSEWLKSKLKIFSK